MDRRKLLLVLAFVSAGLIAALATGVAYLRIRSEVAPPARRYSIGSSERLTEELAIEYARRALKDAGKTAPAMQPVPYWPESQHTDPDTDRLFARNRDNRNEGYVIWSHGYIVTIDRDGKRVLCRVYKPK